MNKNHIDLQYIDEDDVAFSERRLTLACPNCGSSDVFADLDRVIQERRPESCPLDTEGPWLVVPMMCVDDACGTIFGFVLAQDGYSTVAGYATPDPDEIE